MTKLKAGFVLVLSLAAMLVLSSVASADTVSGQGNASGNYYRNGVSNQGAVAYIAGIQVDRDPAGDVIKVRGAARISKGLNASRIQVDRLALGTATIGLTVNTTPANAGTSSTVITYTNWVAVAPKTCTSYRARANYSIRWANGGTSAFSILTPLGQVCGPTSPPVYANCASMNQTFPHGVGRPGAVDHTSGTPVTNYYVSSYIYNANASGRDADKDGIACERL